MTRPDPARIYAAQRAGLLRRLVDAERLDELEAEYLLAGWERHAETIGLSRGAAWFWDDAWRWISEQRSARNAR